MASKKPTMAQAYKAAAKPKDKGIIGEGKDVLGAMGNQVKQDAQFVAAVGKGAAKGAGAIAKGAGKVAGKVANVTIGDIASAPLDVAKNAAKGAGKVAKFLSPLTLQDKNMYSPRALAAINKGKAERAAAKAAGSAAGKAAGKVAPKKDKSGGTLMDSYNAAAAAITSKRGTKSPSAGTRTKTAVDRNYANYARDRKAQGLPPVGPPRPPAPKRNDPGMSKPRGGTPVRKDPGMYKPRGKAPSQSGGRPSKRGL